MKPRGCGKRRGFFAWLSHTIPTVLLLRRVRSGRLGMTDALHLDQNCGWNKSGQDARPVGEQHPTSCQATGAPNSPVRRTCPLCPGASQPRSRKSDPRPTGSGSHEPSVIVRYCSRTRALNRIAIIEGYDGHLGADGEGERRAAARTAAGAVWGLLVECCLSATWCGRVVLERAAARVSTREWSGLDGFSPSVGQPLALRVATAPAI